MSRGVNLNNKVALVIGANGITENRLMPGGWIDSAMHNSNTNKGRTYGWRGVANTLEMWLRCFECARKSGAIPKNVPGLSAIKSAKVPGTIRSVLPSVFN
ncbi:hypothetical protein SeLEV6574_g07555 [Synchytrium endobioticum]|uniref:Uncharacterized protein n=2 Tax=Synchytrium endobioticum TaxID=286115 RepID=A0A507CHR9_9FUNG|nr:hypothetical protein SeLEV6574_g07555 [Synchytrium endobioticum]